MDRMLDKVEKDSLELGEEEITRPDQQENKLLKNFQKWENFLLQEKENNKDMFSDSFMSERNTIQNSKYLNSNF